jgi:predicted amidohydrolase
MKIAAAQMDIVWHDRAANHAKAGEMAKEAKSAGAELLVLPEMFSTGFSLDTSLTAEPLAGATPELLRSLARELDLAVMGGFVLERDGGGAQNVSLVVDRQGNDLACYAKIHLIGLLDEDANYQPGTVPVPFELEGMGAVCFVCYDLRFPELFRMVVDQCQLMVIIASWPSVRQSHWDLLLRARAIENQCFVIGVNRVGQGGGHEFGGGSAVIDPFGQVLAHGGDQETLLLADIDLNQVAEIRSAMPFLKDRQPHLLGGGR